MILEFLILSIALFTLGFVMYLVSKVSKRRCFKYLSLIPIVIGIVIIVVIAIKFFFLGTC